MNITTATFYYPISIALPLNVYMTIYRDAVHFGFIKNKKANINGFLNYLLPILSAGKEKSHQLLSGEQEQYSKTASVVENQLFSFTGNSSPIFDRGTKTISLRITQAQRAAFLAIHHKQLFHYNLDFSQYIRGLLLEYSILRLAYREILFFQAQTDTLITAIEKRKVCVFQLRNETLQFAPISLITSKYSGRLIILGISPNLKSSVSLPFSHIKTILLLDEVLPQTKNQKEILNAALAKFLNQEKNILTPD